jgi:hypothetical protein
MRSGIKKTPPYVDGVDANAGLFFVHAEEVDHMLCFWNLRAEVARPNPAGTVGRGVDREVLYRIANSVSVSRYFSRQAVDAPLRNALIETECSNRQCRGGGDLHYLRGWRYSLRLHLL